MTDPSNPLNRAKTPFVAVDGQSFRCQQDWINRAPHVLTRHPQYHNTEHDGPAKGWRGAHFTTMCFDQLGRRVRNGGDFQRAEDDATYPVWWIWPDQIAELLMTKSVADATHEQAIAEAERRGAERMRERAVREMEDWFSELMISGEFSCALAHAIRALPLTEGGEA